MASTTPQLRDPSLLIQKCFINGVWKDANSRQTFQVYDPATEKLIGSCPDCDETDGEEAIAAAVAALPPFRDTLARERARMLRKWYQLMMDNLEDIATLITWENGKPLADARGEVVFAANFLEWFSEEAPRIYGDTIPSTIPGNRVMTLKEPVGVCGFITPWNFPAAMITRKLGPALAAGCAVVAKTPPETPFTANAIIELACRAGIPPGVLNIITTERHVTKVGKLLTTHPTIRKVSFTGSTAVGKLLMEQASSTVKRVSWELGGNAPFIVFEDADVDAAVMGAVFAKFRSSGQTCVCANRLYVHRDVYDTFVRKFTEKVKEFKVGSGFQEGTTHGPLIHSRAVNKVDKHVQDALAKGAKLLIGGSRVPELGSSFYLPTVLTGMTKEMRMSTEETFGPVAGIFPFSTEAEVIGLANQCDVGLAAYFFASDVKRAFRVAEALEVGMVGINTGLMSDVASPFGGVKQSGFGREGSKYGIEEFLNIKTITYGGIESKL